MADNPLLFYASIILFAVISWTIYKYVLTANNNNAGPHRHRGPEPSSSTAATATAATGATTSTNIANSTATATNNSSTKESSSSSLYNNFDQPKRHPPHLYNPTNKSLHPSKVENGGIIPFKLTFASGYETRLTNNGETEEHNKNDVIITNRKQRARLFAKLFTIADRPPNRGSNIVVIISYGAGNDVAKCHKLQKSLMLLGTYYNLFLLVDYSRQQHQQQQKKEKEEELDREVVKQFRNDLLNVTKNDDDKSSLLSLPTTAAADKLNPQILPPHRIIFTTTPEGKIAFVRQLHEAKLVLLGSSNNKEEEDDDNNNKVKVELERFGFRVVSYPEENCGDGRGGGGGEEGVSALGQFLIP